MQKRTLLIVLGVIIIGIGWYVFRPELLFLSRTVQEELPGAKATGAAAAPVVLSTGRFHSVAHETKGVATIYQFSDGKRVLRFTEFETSNGPDVHIYLGIAADANDNETVTKAGFFPLGAMKGNIGDQNYDIPPEVDLNKYHSVTVWCRRFSVNFATAPLTRPQS
jgi:hypothetical protein